MLNRDWSLCLKTTSNFENLWERKIQKGMKWTCEYLPGFSVPFWQAEFLWQKSSRKHNRFNAFWLTIWHFAEERMAEGMFNTRMALLPIFINFVSSSLQDFFRVNSLMQPAPWVLKLVKEDMMNKYYFANSFLAVSLILYSGFCLVSALGR